MHHLPTALLQHTTRTGSHYDWLLADPRDPLGLLWTARTHESSDTWATRGSWKLEPISPHRRVYLDYQGAISGGRGSVLRVDRGWFVPQLWTASRMVLDLHFTRCAGLVELRRVSRKCWVAMMMACDEAEFEKAQCGDVDDS